MIEHASYKACNSVTRKLVWVEMWNGDRVERERGGKLQVNFKFLSNSWQQEKTDATICQLQIKGDPRNNNLTKKQDYFTEILSQD